MSLPINTEAVWKLLSSRLERFIRFRVEDDATASDLLQESFLRIHKNLGSLQDAERLQAWVFQIARSVVADHYRSKKGPANATNGVNTTERTNFQSEPENFNEEVSRWIPTAIESLPESYREAVKLYELEDLPQKEIARQLGLSLSAVKSRVRRGREKLKQILNDCCCFEFDHWGNVLEWQARSESGCGSCSEPDNPQCG